MPSISRPGRIADLTLTYSNDGGSNALAPLFVVSVTSGNATIGLPGETEFSGSSVQILGIENTGPAGTLPPGYQGTILIPYESTTLTQGAEINFSLQVMTGDSTPMNWSSLESSLEPSYMSAAAWSAVFANLTATFGSTTETYLAALDNEAMYLSQLGEYTDDVQRLFGFAINIANDAATSGSLDSVTDASFPVPGAIPLGFVRQFNSSISGRDTMGPFGYGWTDNWQISASADSGGNLTISDDGALLYFAKNPNGGYTEAPGEYGTLTLANGAYQYVETDGTIIAFNPNGSLDYEQDTNTNRITAGYNAGGELTSLTASNGSAITIAYNAQGLISSITEPGDQTTTYGYDSSGQHLLTFTDEFGTTRYAYATGPMAADANALTSITFADGTGIEWSYDAQGRIASTGRLNDSGPEAEAETYAYPAPGEYTVTNADGDTTASFNDDQGNVGETIDALGNITRYAYDSNDNLITIVAPDGTTTTYQYDPSGNMTSETDPLGYTIQFTYNQFGEPLTFVNQEGYTTGYQYDQSDNLLEQTNPDGTTQQYVYNPLGEVTSSTDPDGQTITYAYNQNGQLTAENLPGGTSDSYTYDSHGNMLTADGPGGDWSFTYNSQNLPTTIVEPYGTLTVRYGVDGNITQMVDQTGFTTNYEYDAVGRLSELTDGSGNLIESYSYDPAGNVISETKGNGTSTTYQYNPDGDITQITNLAPGGSINSQMTYAYNAVGEVTSMTTGGVTTAYGYDADGELTSASSPGDTILYAYDPDGNRTSVTDNGVVTSYVSNDVNEYTSTTTSGVTTSYQYDANGNMIGATANGQTTNYTFNALNQLTGVSGPNETFSYAYDALGYQISSTVNGQATNNLIDPFGLGNVAAQFNATGDLVAHYTYGLGLVSQVSAGGTSYYYDYNLQGSTVGITNPAGAYVNEYSYDPFGQVTAISAGIANPFTFVGGDGVSGGALGLFYMRNRYYDPNTAQFISVDPVGSGGNQTNVRIYAGSDPEASIDPVGLWPVNLTYNPGWTEQNGNQVQGQYNNGEITINLAYADTTTLAHELTHLATDNLDLNLSEFEDEALAYTVGGIYGLLFGSKNDAQKQFNQLGKMFRTGLTPQRQPPPQKQPKAPTKFLTGRVQENVYRSENLVPSDPNDLLGPSGYGLAGFITPGGGLGYTIEFSNEKTAAVPADNVTVTEQLSPNLDWSTFQLGTIGFGSYVVNVPPGLTSYSARVDATATLGVYVDVDASLNLSTGLLTVTFTSLDPTTLDTPSNPLVGFLPPDTDPPNGEGYINYTIQPNTNLATGATINAQASIVFDTNAPIATPEVTNTIDASPPTSTVAALPATTNSPSFIVSWSGSDGAGPGIASYNVYVSDNGGPFTLWQSDTTATSATFTGVNANTYAFYSVATDNVGLVQATPSAAQAITKVVLNAPPSQPAPPLLVPADDSGIKGDDITDDATPAFSGTTAANATVQLLSGSKVIGTATANASGNYVVSAQKALAPGTYSLTVIANNSAGSSPASKPISLKIVAPPSTPSAPSLLPADSNGSPGGETTNLTTPYLTGTTIAGAKVQLLNANGTVLANTTASSKGAYQVKVPGPLSVGSHSFRVDVIDQYGDVSAPSAARTITVVNPPAPVVKSTTVATSKGDIQSVTVTFTAPMTTSSAGNGNNYALEDAGSSHIFGGKGNAAVTIKSVTYSSASDSVKITLAKPVSTSDSLRLTINAQPPSGLQGTDGQFLNEAASGTPGANAVIYLGAPPKTSPPPKPPKKTVTKAIANHVLLARQMAVAPPATTAGKVGATAPAAHPATAAIDAVLARGDLTGLRQPIRSVPVVRLPWT